MSHKKISKVKRPVLEGKMGSSLEIENYKSLRFFLDRTAESLAHSAKLLQHLEAQVSHLRYEISAVGNEYKNLRFLAEEQEKNLNLHSPPVSNL